MGGKDDDYFAERYRQGKKQVILLENSPRTKDWIEPFRTVSKEFGLIPIFYSGVGRDIRPEKPGWSSTVENELIDDFGPAATKVLCFGPSSEHPKDYEDHWVLESDVLTKSRNERVLVYTSDDFPIEVLRSHGYEGKVTMVRTKEEFATVLRNDIKAALENMPID